jgi:hypothetical protein
MKKLSIGIKSFLKIREDDFYNGDKTPMVFELEKGGNYVLSRPRRFGKSLFLDTLLPQSSAFSSLEVSDISVNMNRHLVIDQEKRPYRRWMILKERCQSDIWSIQI